MPNELINLVTKMENKKPCIFCDIVAGKSPDTIIEFDNEHIVIFRDIRPHSDHHYLAVPKKHMQNVRSCTLNDKDLSKNQLMALQSPTYLTQFNEC